MEFLFDFEVDLFGLSFLFLIFALLARSHSHTCTQQHVDNIEIIYIWCMEIKEAPSLVSGTL